MLADALPKIDFISKAVAEQMRESWLEIVPKFDFQEQFAPRFVEGTGGVHSNSGTSVAQPNWPDDATAVTPIVELMDETGYCLVWAPRTWRSSQSF